MLCEICKKEWNPNCSWSPCQLTNELTRRGNYETTRSQETSTTINSQERN